jgi:hypothetical protein
VSNEQKLVQKYAECIRYFISSILTSHSNVSLRFLVSLEEISSPEIFGITHRSEIDLFKRIFARETLIIAKGAH